jgi:hypothetical protein
LTLNEWWGHGYLDYPPRDGDFMELPSGGVYVGDISCSREFTKMGNPRRGVPLPLYACDVSLPAVSEPSLRPPCTV